MLKNKMLHLSLGLLLSAAPFALSQDTAAPPPDQQGPPPMNGPHHPMMSPAERTKHLTRKLNLNPDQQAKVQSALENQQSQMEALHQNSSMSGEDRRAQAMKIHQDTVGQINAVLNPDQQAKFAKMQEWQRDRMERRHPGMGGPGGEQAPPPPQDGEGPPPPQQ